MNQKKILIFSIILILISGLLFLFSQKYKEWISCGSDELILKQSDRQIDNFSNTKISPKAGGIDSSENQPIPKDQLSGQISQPENQTIRESDSQPVSYQIDVSFTSQAPFANWDNLHNEACEEAALIMAEHWLSGEKLTREKAEEEILNSVSWQIENFGGHYDLPAETIVELAKQYFKIEKIEIIYQPTLDDIKEELSSGNLVIVPTAGRLLKNPYYRQPGPVYHLLIVRGYDEKMIITNDPGTRRGEGFKYTYQNFFDAIHDWPYGPPDFGQKLAKEERAIGVLDGQKVMMVIKK